MKSKEDLQKSLAGIGKVGVKFIPRMEGARPIGNQTQELRLVDKLATLVPCVPYSGVVLAGGDLYITHDSSQGYSKEELTKFSMASFMLALSVNTAFCQSIFVFI